MFFDDFVQIELSKRDWQILNEATDKAMELVEDEGELEDFQDLKALISTALKHLHEKHGEILAVNVTSYTIEVMKRALHGAIAVEHSEKFYALLEKLAREW